MEDITKLAVTTDPIMLCRYCQNIHGFSSNPQKLLSRISPLGPNSYPVGCCIHASVAMMKNPDSQDPAKTRKAANQCAFGPIRFSPKTNTPRKLDSRKKENTPSMASVCPITPPAAREKRDQLVPNWNSMGMPVTTPMAKLTAKILVQKRAA